MDEDAQLIGQTIAGRYEVTGLLGTGGMGAVYVAKQMPLGRQVALKVIRPGLITDSQSVERFKREATTVSQLLHPNIVTVYDFGQAERGLLFIAMELLPGENLRQRLRRVGAMPWQTVLGVVRDIAGGLSAAHAQGVIHRDLKPDNVMLIDAGRPDFVKLLDFGVAKLTEYNGKDGHLTNTGMLVGTPGYMAPEAVLKGITTDPRSDIYAVGVLFFEMLTGATMFTAPTPVALVMKHATERPPLISDLHPSSPVPTAVENLVQQMIAKEPDDRPPDAKTLVKTLEHMIRFGDDLPADPFSSGAYRLVQTTGSLPVASRPPAPALSQEEADPTQINAHNPLAIDHTDEDTSPTAQTDTNFQPPRSEPETRTFAGASVANTPETGSTPRPALPSEPSGPPVAVVRRGEDTLDSIRQAGVGNGGGGALIAAGVTAAVLALGVAAAAWWYLGQQPAPPDILGIPTPDTVVPDSVPDAPDAIPDAPRSPHERCDDGEAAGCADAAAAATDPKMAFALHKRGCDAKRAASCVAAAEASGSDDEKKLLFARACELGDKARCEAEAVQDQIDRTIETPPDPKVEPDDKRKTRRKRTRRTRRTQTDRTEKVPVKKPDGFVPDLLFDDKPKRKLKKPKADGHVPDLMLE